jgi:Concanavalin A-like lectin/glucanases superfamily
MFTFTVTRNAGDDINVPITVAFAVGGTATYPTDYTVSGAASFSATTGSILIPAGQVLASFTAAPVPDLVVEANETIVLTPQVQAGVFAIGAGSAWTATIINDDDGAGVGDPLFADVVLLLPLTAASGLVDVKGKSLTNDGSTISTVINDPFGANTGVRAFAGNGARLSVAQSADFAFGAGAFAIEWWIYPTAFPGGTLFGLMDCRAAVDLSPWLVTCEANGYPNFQDASAPNPYYESPVSGLILNQWNYLCVSRTATGKHKIWINGQIVTTSGYRQSNITALGNLLIGDILDSASPYAGSFTGYGSGLRITRAYRDGSIVPTAPFPTN